MKKVFALLLVFVMLLSAAPVLADGDPRIDSVTLWNHSVSIELANLPPINDNSIIEVELYSKDKLLTRVQLAEDKLGELTGNHNFLTCCIPFTGADEYWPQDPVFKPQRDVVADKAVLYVGGEQVDEKACDLDRTTWNAMVPITPGDLYVTNRVDLSREITPKAYENPKDYYLVNSTYGNYVSYTAIMDMRELEGSPLMNELAIANQVPLNEGMWNILSRSYNSLSAEVTMTFTFDPMIDLSNYDTANITLDSNMFKIKDNGIEVKGNTIIINCEFDPTLHGNEEINPIITLYGKNLPIKSSWNGDYVTLVNQGTFSGKVFWEKPENYSISEESNKIVFANQIEYAKRSPVATNDDLVQQLLDEQMKRIIEILNDEGLTIKETTVRDSFTLYIDDPYYRPYNPTPVQPTQPTQPGILPPQTGDMPLWYAIVHFLGLA